MVETSPNVLHNLQLYQEPCIIHQLVTIDNGNKESTLHYQLEIPG